MTTSIKSTARTAGLLYVAMSVLATFSYLYLGPHFVVAGDATATARRISENVTLYRIGLASDLASQLLFIFVVLALYRLFKDVDRKLALQIVVLVCVGVACDIVDIGIRTAPLFLLSGASFLSVFTKGQVDAFVLSILKLSSGIGQTVVVFWGLWLFPFGRLTIKSRYFPKILGYLLYASGVAYVATCFIQLVLPGYMAVAAPYLTTLYFGELGMVLWLAVMGAKEPV